MGSLVVAITALVVGAPPGEGSEVPLRLEKGQEFVYRGVYTETNRRPGAAPTRRFEVESYVFILNAAPGGADAAFLTVQRTPRQGTQETPATARLELAKVDGLGRIKFAHKTGGPRIPPDGPPSLETRAFVELPVGGVSGGLTWEAAEDGEPPATWTVCGLDDQPCGKCLKLAGRQQSESWKRPGMAGWLREDLVWLKLKGGYAVRIERKWEVRDEGRDGGMNSVLVMDLETFNPAMVPPTEAAARQVEIRQTLQYADAYADLLQRPHDRRAFVNLLAAMQTHVNNRTRTPYREALLTLRRNVEIAQTGERPPEPVIVSVLAPPRPADVGQQAPDFLLTDMVSGTTNRLNRLQGQPIVLLIFKPTSPTVRYLLAYADEAASVYAGKAHVLALAVGGDPGAVVQLRSQLRVKVPILDGREALGRFAGDATPRTVILDKFGTVVSITPGWGGEYPVRFGNQLKELLQP